MRGKGQAMFSWLRSAPQRARLTRVRRRFHPQAGEAWFRALPHQVRARFNRRWREEGEEERELWTRQAREILRAGALQALAFAVLNGFCPGDTLASYLMCLLMGMGLGMLLGALRADRLCSGVAGLILFVSLQWMTRGGLSAAHLFMFLPAGAVSAYLGIEREE